MSTLKLSGLTNGSSILKAPDTGSTGVTFTLPASAGTLLTTTGSGANLTGISSVGGATGVDFEDNVKARFGTGNDLEIYHSAANSYIKDAGTGHLKILGTYIVMMNAAEDKNYLYATDGDSVALYHNNNAKLSTSATGITVTGAIAGASNLGKIGQVVIGRRTGVATYAVATTWTAIGSGSNGMNLDITPSATSSKILLTCHINISTQNGQRGGISFFRGSTQIGQGDANGSRTTTGTFYVGEDGSAGQDGYSMQYIDSPNTTSSTTYSVKFFHENTTNVVINQGFSSSNNSDHFTGASSITAMEILA